MRELDLGLLDHDLRVLEHPIHPGMVGVQMRVDHEIDVAVLDSMCSQRRLQAVFAKRVTEGVLR